MTQINVSTKAAIAAKHWEGQDVTELLSTSAAVLPAISATEAGYTGPLHRLHGHRTQVAHQPWAAASRTRTRCRLRGCRPAVNRVFETTSEPALRYGGIFGFEDLRHVLADRQGRIQGSTTGL